MTESAAEARAIRVLNSHQLETDSVELPDAPDTVGTAWAAAFASFCFFASGALIPVLPYIFGAHDLVAVVIAAAAVGLALLGTGAIVGVLSGASPLKRALRQLAIGFGAAGVTYVLGLLFGASLG
jgi:VIT1/CCC1 family predicted Fe2+/Mn2+ transporter